MTDLFYDVATDEAAEVNGVWQKFNADVDLLVARSMNPKHAKMQLELYQRHQQALEADDEAAEKLDNEINIEVMSKTILLGWRSKAADGTVVPQVKFKGEMLSHSVENAAKLLAVKEMRRRVAQMANKVDEYRVKEEAKQGEA